MMRLDYAGGTIFTGTAIAHAVLSYAAALAHAEDAVSLRVPGRTVDGVAGDFQILLGPSSQILVEPTGDPDEVVDDEFLVDIEKRIGLLEHPPYVLPWDEEPDFDAPSDQL